MRAFLCAIIVAALIACGGAAPPIAVHDLFDLASDANAPALTVLRAGGLSGIAFDANGELLAVSDAQDSPRVLTLRVHENPFRLEPTGMIHLWGCPETLDPEGIAILPNGHLLISSEGVQNEEPRTAPGIYEFTRDGEWVRTFNLRNKFIPPLEGPITVGVQENRSFESLALARDGNRFFTAVESALAQDDEPANFDKGTRVRILEYAHRGETFVPAREWVYETDPAARPDFPTGMVVNGVTELLALDDGDLLVLERSYAGEAEDGPRALNRIRIYQVSMQGATDVSNIDSLAGRSVRPVTKRLVLDLGQAPSLPPILSGLENFEGLAFEAPGSDGRRRLWMVSDDNFSATQKTWFVRLRH
jgi:hypothetical protein